MINAKNERQEILQRKQMLLFIHSFKA